MAKATYYRGTKINIEHVAAGPIGVDDIIVVDNNIVIAFNAASAASEVIRASLTGVYRFPKVPSAVIVAGERVSWVAASSQVSNNGITPSAGDIVGFGTAIEGAAATTTEVYVFLTPNVGVKS